MTADIESTQSADLGAGVACPRCSNLIRFSLPELIAAGTIHCPSCGLELSIDSQKSEQALKALEHLSEQMDTIQQDRYKRIPRS
jgi:uncharacterized paraquat-inducible protein A